MASILNEVMKHTKSETTHYKEVILGHKACLGTCLGTCLTWLLKEEILAMKL